MKKILLIAICCIYLCGCGKEENLLKTTCTSTWNQNNHQNYIIWTFKHDGTTIKEKSWEYLYEYDTLDEALKDEKLMKQECQNQNYTCSITRNNKTIKNFMSYKCESDSSKNSDECNYIEEIKSLEKLDFICNEISNN